MQRTAKYVYFLNNTDFGAGRVLKMIPDVEITFDIPGMLSFEFKGQHYTVSLSAVSHITWDSCQKSSINPAKTDSSENTATSKRRKADEPTKTVAPLQHF